MSKDQQYFEIDINSVSHQNIRKQSEEGNAQMGEALNPLNSSEEEVLFRELIFPKFKVKSFSFVISVVQVAVYCLSLLYYYAAKIEWECVLYDFGAGFEPSIKHNFEIHRLFLTPILLHYDYEHLLSNILFQAMILFHLESCYSKKILISIYFFSHLGGMILSNMVYWHMLKIGASFAIFGCFAFEIINLLNQKNQVIMKSKVRFGVFCVFCSVLAIPLLRVYDNRNRIKRNKYLKIIAFYGIIFSLLLFYFVQAIYKGIDTEKVNDTPNTDDNFHWRLLLSNAVEKPIVDNLGHLGGFITGFLLSFYLYHQENESIWFKYIKLFALFIGCMYLICGTIGCFVYDVPKVIMRDCEY